MVWRRPEDIPPEQVSIRYVTAADAPGDLAGQMVAGLVAGTLALVSQRDPGLISEQQASKNLYYAHRLFTSVMLAPKLYSQVCWKLSECALCVKLNTPRSSIVATQLCSL
jgi:hypothetical protein